MSGRPEWAGGLMMLAFVAVLMDIWWPVTVVLFLVGLSAWWWPR